MARLEYRSVSKRTVDGLSVGDKDTVFWDRELPGFVMYDFIPLI